MMEELHSLTVSDERLEDCRDVIEPDLQDLIRTTIASGFTAEEVLIAISELVAEDYAVLAKLPSVH
ncbi:hypothetical protein FHT76_003708 [Rhizobium sp. BK176]|nr:hypothetical protein [Rhizobium sp. BK399]MCS3740008.1 hypothetical protein [Rhizobium sp. BK661]MCS4092042.1 hypothetical protein [Rhizobium sp. BK176]